MFGDAHCGYSRNESLAPSNFDDSSASPGSPRSLSRSLLRRPPPLADVGTVNPELVCISLTRHLLIPEFLFRVRARCFQFRNSVDDIDCECETVNLVIDRQLRRCVGVAAFLVAPHVQVPMIRTCVSEPVYEPRVAVEVEDNRLVDRK